MAGKPVTPERVAVVDLADDLQVRKQTLFKVLKRLGIRASQRREASRRNQNIATITHQEAETVKAELLRGVSREQANGSLTATTTTETWTNDDIGRFYLVQLEPEHDPGRFKVGFTNELEGRLRKHRCSAPFARCLKSWPCKRTWERAAIDSVTAGAEQLHTEVFRSTSLSDVEARAVAFFNVMPKLGPDADDADDSVEEADPG